MIDWADVPKAVDKGKALKFQERDIYLARCAMILDSSEEADRCYDK